MAENQLSLEHFEAAYGTLAPWDIPGPQPALVEIASEINGRVLDAGCGTGEHALYFAGRGCDVTGVDFSQTAIARAKQKAEASGLTVQFLVKDLLTLRSWEERFDCVIDSGVFHLFQDEDATKYDAGIHHVLNPGGKYVFLCFSDAEPGNHGPLRIAKRTIEARLRTGWKIEAIDPVRFSIRQDSRAEFSEGGPHAWRVRAIAV